MAQRDNFVRICRAASPTFAGAASRVQHPTYRGQAALGNIGRNGAPQCIIRREFDEGFDETLTLHRLGVFAELGTSLKTTNALESIHARVESRTAKVDHWKNSEQKQRWLATALLDLEPRLRRIRNYRALPLLREAIKRQMHGVKKSAA